MKLKKLLLTAILFIVTIVKSYAVPAYPYPIKVTQPDGTTITVVRVGNEFFHYDTTEDGVLIEKDKQGIYRYAEVNKKGEIIATPQKAKDKIQRTQAEEMFVKQLRPISSPELLIKRAEQQRVASLDRPQVRSYFPKSGSPKSLVILVNFADLDFVVPNPKQAFHDLLNKKGYNENRGTGSARDYFIDNSAGTFSPDFDVVGPYTLPNKMEFYGKNIFVGGQRQDEHPEQMIIDACKLADANGVDFSQYDTDDNGYVDNVFVYYAGHNEAEFGGANTVWPHRFALNTNIMFDGKFVSDYACTSELRRGTGNEMCGIGTFVHEFGHVLGLADLYPTRGQRHYTLGKWDVMASGPYNNDGRTPPLYSAFQRFRLGFLTPKILKDPKNITLRDLGESNEAYLISETETHNLVGTNPHSREFFLLENRQRKGWDRYLPGHGMLITRIVYNQSHWAQNKPNNNPRAMGVEIIKADGRASSKGDSGDPFPGTTRVDNYTPVLRNGTVLKKQPITDIKEKNTVIFFKYKGGEGGDLPIIYKEGSPKKFEIMQGKTQTQTISVSGEKLQGDILLTLEKGEHYQIKLESEADDKWRKQISIAPTNSVVKNTKIQIRYNPTTATCQSPHNDKLEVSSKKVFQDIVVSLIGTAQRGIYITVPTNLKADNVTYKDFTVVWDTVKDNEKNAAGYYFTVIQKNSNGKDSVIVKDKWTETPTAKLNGLLSDKEYEIKVKASDKDILCKYENFTDYSKILTVKTLPYPSETDLRCTVQQGTVRIFVPKNENNEESVVNIYNALGQKIFFTSTTKEVLDLSNLPKNVVLIVQSGKQRKKIIIN